MSDMCTHEHKVGSVVTVRTQAKAGCPLCEAEALRKRAEKAEARVRAVEAALGLQADYLQLFQTREEELHEAQARVLELEAAMKIDAEATAGIGLAVAEYQERAEKAEARVRELEKTMLFAMGEIALSASAFAIFGAWSTEPWPLALEAKQKVYVVVDDNDNDVDIYETWALAAAHLRAHKGERIEERRR